MKIIKMYHKHYGKELQNLRDLLQYLSITYPNRKLKYYSKALKKIDEFRNIMDDIEYINYETNECYYVHNSEEFNIIIKKQIER